MMKKATTYLAIAFLGMTLMSFAKTPDCKTNCEEQAMEGVTYIESTEEVELGFDTAEYLPEGFDAYKGMVLNLNEVVYIQPEEEIELGFDTEKYLPEGFDAKRGMIIDLEELEYVEKKQEVEFDFNVESYLPEDFDASSK